MTNGILLACWLGGIYGDDSWSDKATVISLFFGPAALGYAALAALHVRRWWRSRS